MAANLKFAKPSFKECEICCEQTNRVKVLSCSHYFCLTCLKHIVAGKKSGSCPKCRSPIDGNSIDQLPWRYFGNITCDLCLELLDTKDVWYCVPCAVSTCSTCRLT